MKSLAKLLRRAAQKIDPTSPLEIRAPRLTIDQIFGAPEEDLRDYIMLYGDILKNPTQKQRSSLRYGFEAFIGIRGGYDETVDAVALTVYEPIAPGEFIEHFATANRDGVFLHGVPFFNVDDDHQVRKISYRNSQQRDAFLKPRAHEITPDFEGWKANGEELS